MTKSKNTKGSTEPVEYYNRMLELVPEVPESVFPVEAVETSHLSPSLTVPDDCYTITQMLTAHVPTMYANPDDLYFDAQGDEDTSDPTVDFDADICDIKRQIDGLRAQEYIKNQQLIKEQEMQRQAEYDRQVIARYQQLQNEKK